MMKRLLSLLLPCFVTACGSITGLENAQSDFACSVDMPARCNSISEIYQSENFSLSPEKRDNSETVAAARDPRAPYEIEKRVTVKADSGDRFSTDDPLLSDTALMTPKRLAEEILTVWMAPFIDKEGDLHDAQRIYVTIRKARWSPESLSEKVNTDSSQWLQPLNDDQALTSSQK